MLRIEEGEIMIKSLRIIFTLAIIASLFTCKKHNIVSTPSTENWPFGPLIGPDFVFGRNCNEIKLIKYMYGLFDNKMTRCDIYYLTKDNSIDNYSSNASFVKNDVNIECSYHSYYNITNDEIGLYIFIYENGERRTGSFFISDMNVSCK
jgi:hypothetical protein